MIELANGWTLRYRQEEAHDKIINSFKNGNKEFLLAANCRFGKTITTLQTLRDYADITGNSSQVILIISTLDIKCEWFDGTEKTGFSTGLIGKKTATATGESAELIQINDIGFDSIPETGRHVLYCSTQKLANKSEKSEDLIRWFNRHAGMKSLVYDECHLGAGTERTVKGIIERLDFDNKIYLSGTPYREHLKKEFGFDLAEGDDKTYLYTIMDERADYDAKLITDYVPVQLHMHILDYTDKMKEIVDERELEEGKNPQHFSVSSAFFKKIFSDSQYEEYATEFLDMIIEFTKKHGIHTMLFYVPLRQTGVDLVTRFGKKYEDRIEFRNLCSKEYSSKTLSEEEQMKLNESEAAALSEFYSTDNGKLKIGVTCNKCGTGTTLKGLDAVAFLKDTVNAIPFIQKSQRVRTPEAGKSVGYCLCFNQWQGLRAFNDYAKATSTAKDDKNGKGGESAKINDALNNGAIKLFLNLQEIENYETIIDIMKTYRPGQYPLFSDFDFSEWEEGTFVFLFDLQTIKSKLLKEHPELRNSEAFNKADTLETLQRALEDSGLNVQVVELTVEEMRQALEDNFVETVRFLYNTGKTLEEASDTDSYDPPMWGIVTNMFGTEDVWKYLLDTYPRYMSMVYNYLIEEDKKDL